MKRNLYKMSKILYICIRNRKQHEDAKARISRILERLRPDNIHSVPIKIVGEEGVAIGLLNANKEVTIKNNSVCLGNILEGDNWQKTQSTVPDGTYAIFRTDSKYVEVLTDVLATRTIWYFMDEETFIASTSQRAIVSYMGSFDFDENVIPWILSSGTIGYSHSWDRRIKRMLGDSTLLLKRNEWTLKIKTRKVNFQRKDRSYNKYKKLLTEAIEESIKEIKIDAENWILPLSGGYDSRAIMCFLKNRKGLKTVTWGNAALQDVKNSDAQIAKKLASYYEVENIFSDLDSNEVEIDKIFNRFMLQGEGRIDHIAGYVDGFKTWKDLYEKNVVGILRGDNGFGWKRVYSDLDVRVGIGIPLCEDYSNLKALTLSGDFKQEFPQELNKRFDETRELWRDRLHHQVRVPIVLAALNDLKLNYVGVINPLLTRRIIKAVRELPDDLRTDKALFKKIVRAKGPRIKFASKTAVYSSDGIMQSKKVLYYLKEKLSSSEAKLMFPDWLYKGVHEWLNNKTANVLQNSFVNSFVKYIPKSLKSNLRKVSEPKKNVSVVLFRMYMLLNMQKIFNADTKWINNKIKR